MHLWVAVSERVRYIIIRPYSQVQALEIHDLSLSETPVAHAPTSDCQERPMHREHFGGASFDAW